MPIDSQSPFVHKTQCQPPCFSGKVSISEVSSRIKTLGFLTHFVTAHFRTITKCQFVAGLRSAFKAIGKGASPLPPRSVLRGALQIWRQWGVQLVDDRDGCSKKPSKCCVEGRLLFSFHEATSRKDVDVVVWAPGWRWWVWVTIRTTVRQFLQRVTKVKKCPEPLNQVAESWQTATHLEKLDSK